MLRLEGVRKSFRMPNRGEREVLRGVDALVRRGDAIGILGRNGAGKSTLLRLIKGLARPGSGRLELGAGLDPKEQIVSPGGEKE